MDIQALYDRKANHLKEGRALVDQAEAAGREMTTEETTEWDRRMSDSAALSVQIDREQRMAADEALVAQAAESRGTVAGQTDVDGDGRTGAETRDGEPGSGAEGGPQMRAFGHFLRAGRADLAAEEKRALQADSADTGGYLQAPQQFVRQLIQAVDDMVFIRTLATKQTVGRAQSLGVASLDADPADADWTAEILTGNEDTAMKFAKRELFPHPLAKRLKVSEILIEADGVDVEALVRERLAYKFGVTQEKGFMTGTGANQPLGVFTASGDGISTGRDYSTDNTTTAITFDNLIGCKYNIKGNYWARLAWIFHRDAMRDIAKLKDGEGQYIWRESVRVGEPDRLLNFPVNMSEYAPNTFTTGLYVGILGDFSFYWIADALSMRVRRLAARPRII